MDIVYPYDGRDGGSVGVAVSIAGFRKFFSACGEIWTVGITVPGARNIPRPDSLREVVNVVAKLLDACACDRISDPFLAVADDIVPLRPFSETPLIYAGALRDVSGSRRTTCIATAKLLESMGLPALNFETHTPRLIRKAEYVRAMGLFDWRKGKAQPMSVYANACSLPKVPGDDAKLRRDPDDMDAETEGRQFVSIDQRCSDVVREWLKKRVSIVKGGAICEL